MVSKSVVRARLRKGKDDDLRKAVEGLIRQGYDEADLVREGLRILLGLEQHGKINYCFSETKRRQEVTVADKPHNKSTLKSTAPPVLEKDSNNPRTPNNTDDDLDRLLGF